MNKNSGIRDNRKYGTVGDFISKNVNPNSKLAFVSAYFTIYAYQQLKNRLDKIDHLRFLFGEPRFLASMDPNKTDKKQFEIEDNKLVISLRGMDQGEGGDKIHGQAKFPPRQTLSHHK